MVVKHMEQRNASVFLGVIKVYGVSLFVPSFSLSFSWPPYLSIIHLQVLLLSTICPLSYSLLFELANCVSLSISHSPSSSLLSSLSLSCVCVCVCVRVRVRVRVCVRVCVRMF